MEINGRTGPPARPGLRTPLLILASSLAMAAGLLFGTAVPAVAASQTTNPDPAVSTRADAGGDLTFTLDPGLSIGSAAAQGFIKSAQSANAQLSTTIKREAEEFSLGWDGDVAQAPNFKGTVSIAPDGTGLSVTIPAAQAQTSQAWLRSAFAYTAGWLAGLVAGARCTAAVPASAVVCESVGGLFSTLVRGLFIQAFNGTHTDPGAYLTHFEGALKGAVWGVKQAAVLQWVHTALAPVATATRNALKAETAPWIQPALPWIIGDLSDVASRLPNDVAAWGWQPTTAADVTTTSSLSCDVYEAYGTPCAAAYSMDRALYADYDGPLYQVQRTSDGARTDVGLLSTGGDVNAAEQNSFCAGTTCVITEVYDQSPEMNDLGIEGAGGAASADHGADASALPITINGKQAYGLYITGQIGYRKDDTQGIAVNGRPEGMYMVASGTHVNSNCCMDFGNVEADNLDNGASHMDAVNLSTVCPVSPCAGSGPWVEADLENGLYISGGGSNPADTGSSSPFATAVLKNNGTTNFELEGGNAQSGGLSTYWNGSLPSGYSPMHQEGAIVVGTGGDNSDWDVGSFFEGVMTQGFPSDAADAAVQSGVVAADYSGYTGGPTGTGGTAAAGPSVVHSGYTSVYTVDASNGDLQESYVPAVGDPWSTQNLSALYGTPPVMPGTEPVAVVHDGYTSVYTVDASSGDLQETYLPALGDPWSTQDLSARAGTPPTNRTPTAVYHSGYTSVYTADTSSGDLQETYLPALGDPWSTQDLSARSGTPPVRAGTSPVSIVHSGYTSVYTVDSSGDLQETYLPALGDPWSTQDLSAEWGTPSTATTPTALVHDGFTSVYTVDSASGDLQETYLPTLGNRWITLNLAADFGTPAVLSGTAPAAVYHTGYASVYTVDASDNHLQETYLPAPGGLYTTQDMSTQFGTPSTAMSPFGLVHPDTSGNLTWTSVYTIDQSNGDLQETYLPVLGQPWTTQNLSVNYGTPPVYR